MHVVPQTRHEGHVHLAGIRQGLGDLGLGFVVVVLGGQLQAFRGGGKFEVRDEHVVDELRCPGDQAPVRSDDHRVTVEHQLVLSAPEVDVGERRTDLHRPP